MFTDFSFNIYIVRPYGLLAQYENPIELQALNFYVCFNLKMNDLQNNIASDMNLCLLIAS